MIGRHWLEDVRWTFAKQRGLLERALDQVSDEDFFRAPDEDSNSCAGDRQAHRREHALAMDGFPETDGEKPDRNRDGEFEIAGGEDRVSIERALADGWRCLESALDAIDPARLDQNVMIRGEEHTVMQAVHRQISHYSSHIGQVVYVAKMWKGPAWKSLSIPKGQSGEFNKKPDKYGGR